MERRGTLGSIQPSLPSAHYSDADLHRREMEAFFYDRWICVGREQELASTGEYVTRQIADRSVLILRDEAQGLRGFYNTCRHRGSPLCAGQRGSLNGVIICPYHAWTYGLDGRLRATPNILPVDNFDMGEYSLYPVSVEAWDGFLFVHLGQPEQPLADLDGVREASAQYQRYGTGDLRAAARVEYDIDCNWKLIMENFSECYHCPGVHPEWCETQPRMKRGGAIPFLPDATDREKYGGGSLMADGFRTLSWTGQTTRPPLRGLDEFEQRIIMGNVLWPNFLISYQPDYVHTQVIMPTGPTTTHMVYEWLFDTDTMAMPDFDPSDAVEMWDLVNRQDFGACILAQRGLRNPSHIHSVYVPQERGLHAFNQYILDGLYPEGRPAQA